jgi:hypothetical protein
VAHRRDILGQLVSFIVVVLFISSGAGMTETAGVSFFQFVYRSNPDKTMDAICALCFTTVATAANEADLHEP